MAPEPFYDTPSERWSGEGHAVRAALARAAECYEVRVEMHQLYHAAPNKERDDRIAAAFAVMADDYSPGQRGHGRYGQRRGEGCAPPSSAILCGPAPRTPWSLAYPQSAAKRL